jgi:galactokinase
MSSPESAVRASRSTPSPAGDAPSTEARVLRAFRERFGESARLLARAPGRVNLLGEHTDYNDGFVLPMAIDRSAFIALRPRSDRRVVLHSLDFDESNEFDLSSLEKGKGWAEYVKGTAWALQDAGLTLRGFDGVIAGDVPIGAGLSSSAALEVAAARAFQAVSDATWDPVASAKWAQRAENKWVGVNCGIMDQLISAAGQDGHALLIDCRDLSLRAVPLPPKTVVVILDTATRRGLQDSAYNERRSQCEKAAKLLGKKSLRDVSKAELTRRWDSLPEVTRRRAHHVVTENARVLSAVKATEKKDAATFGKRMYESHRSLQKDYEVSSEALDAMVVAARKAPGVFGARMTGAGFGGCAVALVDEKKAARFVAATEKAYRAETNLEPAIYVCRPSPGAEVKKIS